MVPSSSIRHTLGPIVLLRVLPTRGRLYSDVVVIVVVGTLVLAHKTKAIVWLGNYPAHTQLVNTDFFVSWLRFVLTRHVVLVWGSR